MDNRFGFVDQNSIHFFFLGVTLFVVHCPPSTFVCFVDFCCSVPDIVKYHINFDLYEPLEILFGVHLCAWTACYDCYISRIISFSYFVFIFGSFSCYFEFCVSFLLLFRTSLLFHCDYFAFPFSLPRWMAHCCWCIILHFTIVSDARTTIRKWKYFSSTFIHWNIFAS